MIPDVDDDDCGMIVYEEFLKMMAHETLNRNPKDEIPKTFRLFDDDDAKKISSRNPKRVATTPRSQRSPCARSSSSRTPSQRITPRSQGSRTSSGSTS